MLFAGNIGAAQRVDTIIEAARILKDEKVCFHIVGDGIELENLKKKADGLSNVVFYGRKPLDEMADAMLVTLTDDSIISLTLPGKVQSYMAAGKPIIGAAAGETLLVLRESQGGYCGRIGDSKAMANNILNLMNSGDAVQFGRGNRAFYLNTFSKEKFMDTFLEKLNSAVEESV